MSAVASGQRDFAIGQAGDFTKCLHGTRPMPFGEKRFDGH
jgi:hypothetical protein